MRIAIVGGGFTGLTAAYELAKRGHKITLFEKDKVLGGLAHGFKRPGWDLPRARLGLSGVEGSRGWHLEAAYHHLFTNDHAILSLVNELGLSDKLIIKRPITANYISPSVIARSLRRSNLLSYEIATPSERSRDDSGVILPFDSPLHLLTYPGLSIMDKLRTGFLLASIKINPFWQPFEWMTTRDLFLTIGGRRAWEAIWEPLMIGKFDSYADRVAASWLWARIKKRTPHLMYLEGGFHSLVTALEQAIKKHGGTIHTGIQLDKLDTLVKFDRTLLTIPTPTTIPHLHAQTLILETKEPILKDVYWLNITDRSFPFLAVVAHTNFIDRKHYGGYHITYFGNYLPDGHPFLSITKHQLLKKFMPFILRLTHNSKFIIHNSFLFTSPFAQPVHELHYSRRAPKLKTNIPNVYLANMDSIYPWDRGTNFAVALGRRAARSIMSS